MFDSIMDIVPMSLSGDKLKRYLAVDPEDMKDGLKWWHERRGMFPQLSRMACDYLSIPSE